MGLKSFLRNIQVKHGAILALIISVILVLIIPGDLPKSEAAELSLAVIGILFGLIVGFFFSDLWNRWVSVRENVAVETASMSGYLNCINIFKKNHKEWCEKQKKLIIEYLKQYFKYEWDEESPEQDAALAKIGDSFTEIKLKSDEEIETWQALLGMFLTMDEARNKNEILGKDKLSLEGWLALIILGGSLLIALFLLKTSDFSSMLLTTLLTAATITLFFIIRDLSDLAMGEEEVTFEPYLKIYDVMNEPRQYWRKDIENERIKPRTDKKYELYD